ncbi:hypothetical protein [Asticcacaulis solisilvae]|uniref:hypothetical protein n=1 Tax=Asticcacaulis solisilvae TaxID=1217274 RepID=UPI003FD7CEA3
MRAKRIVFRPRRLPKSVHPAQVKGQTVEKKPEALTHLINSTAGIVSAFLALLTIASACYQYGLLSYYGIRFERVPIGLSDLSKTAIVSLPACAVVTLIVMAVFVPLDLIWQVVKFADRIARGRLATSKVKFDDPLAPALVLLTILLTIKIFCPNVHADSLGIGWGGATLLLYIAFSVNDGARKAGKSPSPQSSLFAFSVYFLVISFSAGWLSAFQAQTGDVTTITRSGSPNPIPLKVIAQYEKGVLVDVGAKATFIRWDDIASLDVGEVKPPDALNLVH